MPEELNRLVADHCSDRLYAPTPQAMENLRRENLANQSVLTGDVMLDAIQHNIGLSAAKSDALRNFGVKVGEFGLVTVHRPANTTGDALQKLLSSLEQVAKQYLPLLFPVHPRTRKVLAEISYRPPSQLQLIEPVPYLDCIALIQAATIVITDSGGMQKEAAFLGTPCITARDETEWTETVDIGVNRLVPNDGRSLAVAVAECLKKGDLFGAATLEQIRIHFGDGHAAACIVRDCVEWLS
jgi:UDP-N-acetylglucosamine 2-epimerase